jgi:hypothetical protein
MRKLKRPELIWGLVGFTLGALLSGAAAGAIGYASARVPSSTMQEAAIRETGRAFPIFLPPVKSDEIETTISSLPKKEQRIIREDLVNQKYELLWLTIWDWDTAPGEEGNTISVTSDEFRRIITLNGQRTRTVIPRPKSGYIELRGEATEDGNVSISLLSGTQPIALPAMPPGRTQKIIVR